MRAFRVCSRLIVALSIWSCGSDDGASGKSNGGAGGAGATGGSAGAGATGGSAGTGGGGSGATGGGGQAGAAPFDLTSSAFAQDEMIPVKHACSTGGGQNVSPPLAWTAGPAGTQSYAIVMRDIDFQNGFVHWVIWDIPGSVLSMAEGVEAVFEPSQPAGAKQAPLGGTTIGYFGPCSPTVYTYEFTLYALPDATLPGLDASSTKDQAEAAIEAAPLASAKLSGES